MGWPQRIAHEMAKDNNWVRLVSPNTVRRILLDAGLWSQITSTPSKKCPPGQARTADKPAQTFNIDICFVPATHEVVSKLPAVSGSSGRLVVERTLDQAAVDSPTWPGRVFEQQDLTYQQAMDAFVDASANKSSLPPTAKSPEALAAAAVRCQKRQIRQEEDTLRVQRRAIRIQRKLEDEAWSTLRDQRRTQQASSSTNTVQRPSNEPQTDLIEPQADSIAQPTDSIAQPTDLFERQSPALSQKADFITHKLLASEQDQSYDAQVSLTDLTSRSAPSVDPVSLANEPTASVTEQDALPSLAVQPTPSQATEGVLQTISVGSVVLATEPVVSVGRPALLTAQQATSVTQPATSTMRQITSTMRLAPPVTQSTVPVAQITTSVAQATTPVAQSTNSIAQVTTPVAQATTPVAQSTAPVAQITTSVAQATTSVAQATTPVAQATTSVAQATTPIAQPIAQATTPVAQATAPVAQVGEKKAVAEASQGHVSDSQWRQIKLARKKQNEQRKKEDVQWREKRNSILQRLGELPLTTAWVAILVIVDNCTRQCLSLPLFMVGPHVTAKMTALRVPLGDS